MDNNNKWDELSLTEKSEIMKQAVANGITDLNEIKQTYNEYADGGSMDNPPNQLPEVEVTAQYPYEQRVIDTMNNSSPEFLERLRNNDRRSVHNPDGTSSTHVLGSADNIVFPEIMDVNGKLIDNRSMPWQSAMRYAIKNNDYIEFPTEGDARYFGEHYKKYFPKFFDNTFADGGKVAHDARYNHVTQIYQSYINHGVNPQIALELTNQKIAEKGWTGWVSGDNKRYGDVNSFTDHTIDQFNRLYPDSLKSNNFNQFFQGIEGGRTKYNPTPNIYRQHLLQTRPGVKKRINEYRRLQGQSPLSLVSPTPTPLPWEESILYNPQLPLEIPTEQPVIAADGGYLFKGGGYIPSASIKRDIVNFEGSSMKTNRSFEAEAKDFNKVIPLAIRNKLSQKQLDALYSYGYNVGMGNLKNRVLPTLTAYTQGKAGADDVAASMWASKDIYMRGLQRRRTYERNMFTGNSPVGTRESIVSRAINMDLSGLPTVVKFSGDTPKFQYDLFPPNPTDYGTPIDWSTPEKKIETPTIIPKEDNNGLGLLALINQIYDSPKQEPLATYTPQRNNSMFVVSVPTSNDTFLDSSWFKKGGYLYGDGGVTSSNGQYHVNPTDYLDVLSNVENNKPVEVTLPDVTVKAADPKNYRSSYDPNGFMDFMNAVTLGAGNRFSVSQDARLVKDIYDATTGNKSWKDVVNSAILGNEGIFDNPYANMALDIVVPTVVGKYGSIANVGKGIANTTAKGAVNIGKSVANATKDLSKSAYNLYDNGTLWDRYTTFRGRFGNYSDNPFVNVYATTARRFGLPDKARIPADAMRKMGQTSGDLVNIKDGVVDFTGGKSWGHKPHVNFTLDRGVGSHTKGNWDGRDMYIMPTEDFINQTLPSGSLKSIEPTDMFANGVHVTEDPSKVTVISGDIETLKKAQEAGMQTLSSPKLRRMYQNELNYYNQSIAGKSPFLAKTAKTPKRALGIDYAREVQRLQGQRGTPTLSDFRLLENMTGLKSGVTSGSEYNEAINAINHMLHDQVGVAKQYVYPNGRAVGWSINGINNELKMLKQLPYNNVFYDPASYVEFNWKHAIGLE